MRRIPFIAAALGIIVIVPGVASAKPKVFGGKGMSWSVGFQDPALGAEVQGISEDLRAFFGAPKDRGLLVGRVEAGSAAARAGVKVGDVITDVAGQPVDQAWDVSSALAGKAAGDDLEIAVVRGKQKVALETKLTDDDLAGGFFFSAPNLQLKLPKVPQGSAWSADLQKRLDATEKKLRELEDKLDKLFK